MAANLRALGRSGLARALVQHGKLRESEVDTLAADAKSANVSFIEQLVASRKMSALEVAEFASAAFGMPLLDLAAADAARFPAGVIDGKLVQTRRALPLARRGNRLFVAISDPSNTQALDDVKFQ